MRKLNYNQYRILAKVRESDEGIKRELLDFLFPSESVANLFSDGLVTITDDATVRITDAGQKAGLLVIEKSEFADKKEAEVWAKERERYWISHYSEHEPGIFNGPQWSGHPIRKSIPKGIKTAWCETHAVLWDLDRNGGDELRLLEYLKETHGSITKKERQPDGSILLQSIAGISLAQSQYQRRRFRFSSSRLVSVPGKRHVLASYWSGRHAPSSPIVSEAKPTKTASLISK